MYTEGVPKISDLFPYRPSDEFPNGEIENIVNDKGYVAASIRISDSISEVISWWYSHAPTARYENWGKKSSGIRWDE